MYIFKNAELLLIEKIYANMWILTSDANMNSK